MRLSEDSLLHRAPPLALTWTSHLPGPPTPPIPTKTLPMKLLTCRKALAMARPLCIPRRGPHHPTDQVCGCSLRLRVPQAVPVPQQSPSFPVPSPVTRMEGAAPLSPWVFHSLL